MEQLVKVRIVLDKQCHAIQSPELPQRVAERYTQKAVHLRVGLLAAAGAEEDDATHE